MKNKRVISLVLVMVILFAGALNAKAATYYAFEFYLRSGETKSTNAVLKEDNLTGLVVMTASNLNGGAINFRIRTSYGAYATEYVTLTGNARRDLAYLPGMNIPGAAYRLYTNPDVIYNSMYARGYWAP
ncbi:hypothetical protein [Microaceticoccus formicicus]|uniref:hypothetical protein n=1 Tax=Microaceticoccus formicicus TaxID=3118105 RepID=UPI003CD00D39|nr:hypothetical protein VZL98_07310 [Peptoniphilaceae bacterium AMB_02]